MNRRKFLFGVPVAAAAVVVAEKLQTAEPRPFRAEYRWQSIYGHGEMDVFRKRLAEAQANVKRDLENIMYAQDGAQCYYSGYDLLK